MYAEIILTQRVIRVKTVSIQHTNLHIILETGTENLVNYSLRVFFTSKNSEKKESVPEARYYASYMFVACLRHADNRLASHPHTASVGLLRGCLSETFPILLFVLVFAIVTVFVFVFVIKISPTGNHWCSRFRVCY